MSASDCQRKVIPKLPDKNVWPKTFSHLLSYLFIYLFLNFIMERLIQQINITDLSHQLSYYRGFLSKWFSWQVKKFLVVQLVIFQLVITSNELVAHSRADDSMFSKVGPGFGKLVSTSNGLDNQSFNQFHEEYHKDRTT